MRRLRILIPSILVASTIPMVSVVGCGNKDPEPTGYYTIHFKNVVTPIPDETVKDGDKGVRPKNPVKEDYGFTGWYTDQSTTNRFDWDTPITHNYTLYAGWVYVKETPLTFTATTNCTFYVGVYQEGELTWETPNLSYSINDGDWKKYQMPEEGQRYGEDISLEAGDIIKFYGDNHNGFNYCDDDKSFTYEFDFTDEYDENPVGSISGNIMSLLSSDFANLNQIPCDGCFSYLFNFSNISSASGLNCPATQLKPHCYDGMFANCSFLEEAPGILPAETLSNCCYSYMFYECESLTTPPKLLATTLASGCYYSMFEYCTSLEEAPELSATTLAEDCYFCMFELCTSLKIREQDTKTEDEGFIFTCPSEGRIPDDAVYDMFWGTSGTFKDGTPNPNKSYYWYTSEPKDEYLTFTATEDCNFDIHYYEYDATPEVVPNLYYSINDDKTWTAYEMPTTDETSGEPIPLEAGDTIRFYGNNSEGFNYYDKEEGGYYTYRFEFTNDDVEGPLGTISGNIMSLLSDDFGGLTEIPCDGCFNGLFEYHSNISSASDLVLPADELTPWCYGFMFDECYTLTAAPELPADTLAEECYFQMFSDTALTTAPKLPAKTLAKSCYDTMFWGCTSLTTAPELPAKILAPDCYAWMFTKCSSLTTAPDLPATTLAKECYCEMFRECTSLTKVPTLQDTTLFEGCYYEMFDQCASLCIREQDTKTEDEGFIFTCPDEGSIPENALNDMFRGTTGTFKGGTPNPNKSYYWYTNPLCFEKDGTTSDPNPTIGYKINGSLPNIHIQTSFDGITWSDWNGSNIILGDGQKLYVRNTETTLSTSDQDEFQFVTSENGKIKASGNVNSMINYSALTSYCYRYMFLDCASLTTAPELPSTALAWGCYNCMFRHCTSLTTAPELPATALDSFCYSWMFEGCTSLKIRQQDTETEDDGFIFTCPDEEDIPEYAVFGMFNSISEESEFKGKPNPGKSYYWYA